MATSDDQAASVARIAQEQKPISKKILHAYFGRVVSLTEYIQSITRVDGNEGCWFLQDEDSDEYKELLNSVIVCEEVRDKRPAPVYPTPGGSTPISFTELLEKAQMRIFSREGGKATNILVQGYRLKGDKGKRHGSRSSITNFFVNTMVTALQSRDWELLLSRIGASVSLHLLVKTSIFVSLPNGCFCQLTGIPLVHLKPRVGRLSEVEALPEEGQKTEELRSRVTKRGSCEMDEVDTRGSSKRPKIAHETSDMKAKALSRTAAGVSNKTSFSTVSTDSKSRIPTSIPSRHASSATLSAPIKRPISEILFARASMFYARPVRQARTGHIMLGLPTQHVLNRVKNRHWEESHRLAQDPSELAKDDAFKSRHMCKYVFPKQFGLVNVFTEPSVNKGYEQFNRQKFADREEEIKKLGPVKTPKRVKPALIHLSEMIRKHQKCGYLPLLDMICPSKLKRAGTSETMDSTVILELVSEQSIDLQSQLVPDGNRSGFTNTTCTSMLGNMSANASPKHKPRFSEFMCSHLQVFRFVRLVTKCVIPRAFFGCDKNFKLIMKYVKQFISDNRFTSTSLHNVLQGFSITECDWVMPPKPSMKRTRAHVPITETEIRRGLVEEFLFWYFDSFLVPLLKTTFYITDSSAFRRRVLYFRQDDWDILCQPLLDRLASTTFERLEQREAEHLLRQRKLGFSFVRLLPKDTGVRPIVNLRRRRRQAQNKGPDLSINQILQTAFQILTYEKNSHADSMGATVFGFNEIYSKLTEFRKSIANAHGKLPPLYFVKVDVKACFDTIEQSKLLQILGSLISEETYMIQRYGVVAPSASKITRTYVKKAYPDSEHPHFLNYAQQLATLLRYAIISDLVVYPFAFREDIIQLLEEHISSNLVKIGQNYYRQVVGIPQGSILSSLLCSFFYADLERTSLGFAMEGAGNTLLRLIDDYLFITTSVVKAKKFLEVMNRGHPEYGCFISPDKTLVNFDDSNNSPESITPRPVHSLFPWCGLLIDTKNLSVQCDYSRFHDTYLADSLTVEKCSHIGTAFAQRMLQLNRRACHPIFTDISLNRKGVVITNIYQSFLVTAMKMHTYIRHLSGMNRGEHCLFSRESKIRKRKDGVRSGGLVPNANKSTRVSMPFRMVQQVIRYTHALIRRLGDRAQSKCTLHEDVITWLGLHAFHQVLVRKPTIYMQAGILECIQEELAHRRFVKIRRKLSGVAKESLNSILREIKF